MANLDFDWQIDEYMIYCRSRKLREKTMDIYTLSRLLGHSSVTITEKAYLDLTDDDFGERYQHYSPVNNMR